MDLVTKGVTVGGFTYTEDKSTEFYNKESLGFKGSIKLDLKCNDDAKRFLQSMIDDAETEKYKIESEIKMKIGDVVGVGFDGGMIKIKITELYDGAAIGVLISEQANKKD